MPDRKPPRNRKGRFAPSGPERLTSPIAFRLTEDQGRRLEAAAVHYGYESANDFGRAIVVAFLEGGR